MNGQGIVFRGPHTLEFEPVSFDPLLLAPDEILVTTERTLISPGSELSVLNDVATTAPAIYQASPGRDFDRATPWCEDGPYPARTGYANIGRVAAAGVDAPLGIGQRVLTMTRHASVVRTDTSWFALAIPDDLSNDRAPFVRLAGVSMTALRVGTAGIGDRVAVIGLGLVGNLAAQLFLLAGCEVIAFDPSPGRRAIAEACGIKNVNDPEAEDPVEVTRRWAGASEVGGGARVTIEATDRSEHLVDQAVAMTGRSGEVILLGTPRRPLAVHVEEMFARIHWLGIKVIGAIEWQFPVSAGTPRARHTMETNYLHLIELIRAGRLSVDPLLTHVLPADRASDAYQGLTTDIDHFLGVELDWAGQA